MPVKPDFGVVVRYLFKRKGSNNYYVRLQAPGQKLIERSLGTTDVKAAEIAAADLVKQHKAFMYRRRQARVTTFVHKDWVHDYEPGLHTVPEGGHVMATEIVLTFTDAAGKITGTKPNGGPVVHLSGAPLPAALEFQAFDDAYAGIIGEGPIPTERPKFVAANSHPDDALLETYLTHNGIVEEKNGVVIVIDPLRERQAREIWRIFRTVVDKPLRECTREDGRAIVAYMVDEAEAKGREVKSATLRRRMVPLVAAINLAIEEGKHKGINPFESCVAKRDDEEERDPFNDDDMKKIRANLHKLDANDQLLLRVLATTAMRRGEAFEIAGEKTEDGIRYCEVGADKGVPKRRVPFPKLLLPHLPKKITGPLFIGDYKDAKSAADSAGDRFKAFLKEIGVINDEDGRTLAPMHSFRHRAANRLRRVGAPEDVREAIGGWANGKKKISRKYGNKHGQGYPVKVLKAAIDKIGM